MRALCETFLFDLFNQSFELGCDVVQLGLAQGVLAELGAQDVGNIQLDPVGPAHG